MGEHSNKIIGKTKQVTGRATGNRGLEAEGRTQEATGKAQGAVNDAGRKIEAALGKVGDKLAAKRRQNAGDRPERARRDLDRDY